jgi:hypothetical protein
MPLLLSAFCFQVPRSVSRNSFFDATFFGLGLMPGEIRARACFAAGDVSFGKRRAAAFRIRFNKKSFVKPQVYSIRKRLSLAIVKGRENYTVAQGCVLEQRCHGLVPQIERSARRPT